MRVLFVEDSQRLQESVSTGLRKLGFAVDVAGDGESGLFHAESRDYDVIVLDVMLPGIDGLTVLRRLRERGRTTHVLLLTAMDAVEDRVHGLRSGADDYLVKPFAFDEFVARVQALARRGHGRKDPVVTIGDLRVDLAARTASRRGVAIDLAPRDFALLEYLVVRRGAVVGRTEIEAHIYDDRAEPMSNVVDAAVYALRRKIDVAGAPSLIETRRGAGYLIPAGER